MTRVLGVEVGGLGERVGQAAERSPLGGAARAAGDLGEFLREQREGAQLSLRQLAAAAGVSNPYLSQVERGLRRPSAEVLQQIAKGLRISAEALYVRAGILDERPGSAGDVHAALTADPYLSERQREALLEIYLTFRAENARSEVPATTGAGGDAPTDVAVPPPAAPAAPAPTAPSAPARGRRRPAAATTAATTAAAPTPTPAPTAAADAATKPRRRRPAAATTTPTPATPSTTA
ncbi:helix-turn-helix domain-containing protein [Pseudokineococcus lusitanus]|uniref:Transcriptional regulator with XRE-family HTH domain n=1 Tax=Pseudokineococcus lusitanus TaxID=763993 RepID=A0A3N1HK43_9ACTN|nr:helix-turn-helix transcriptional regulator [Pseudokineococcus lusitanus]ROP42850.1 transcriptional regulator with XRE-family HTH domain [Pseudokineococcus lusitanus]